METSGWHSHAPTTGTETNDYSPITNYQLPITAHCVTTSGNGNRNGALLGSNIT